MAKVSKCTKCKNTACQKFQPAEYGARALQTTDSQDDRRMGDSTFAKDQVIYYINLNSNNTA